MKRTDSEWISLRICTYGNIGVDKTVKPTFKSILENSVTTVQIVAVQN